MGGGGGGVDGMVGRDVGVGKNGENYTIILSVSMDCLYAPLLLRFLLLPPLPLLTLLLPSPPPFSLPLPPPASLPPPVISLLHPHREIVQAMQDRDAGVPLRNFKVKGSGSPNTKQYFTGTFNKEYI